MNSVTEAELELLTEACRRVPLTNSTYIATDYVSALLDTVIEDLQSEGVPPSSVFSKCLVMPKMPAENKRSMDWE